jgi:hypothetical protein
LQYCSLQVWRVLTQMICYRAYVVGTDGYFIRVVELDCADDRGAIKLAKQCTDGGNDIELWQGDRFVIRLVRKAD